MNLKQLFSFIFLFVLGITLGCSTTSPPKSSASREIASVETADYWSQLVATCMEVSAKSLHTCEPSSGIDKILETIQYHTARSSQRAWFKTLVELCNTHSTPETERCAMNQGPDKTFAALREIALTKPYNINFTDYWTDLEALCLHFNKSQFPKCSRHDGIGKIKNSLKYSCTFKTGRESQGCLSRASALCKRYSPQAACDPNKGISAILNDIEASPDNNSSAPYSEPGTSRPQNIQ